MRKSVKNAQTLRLPIDARRRASKIGHMTGNLPVPLPHHGPGPAPEGRNWLRVALTVSAVGAVLAVLAFVAIVAAMIGLGIAALWFGARLLRNRAGAPGQDQVIEARKTPDGWVTES
jgi:small-conductance mechanosensitive channel